MDDDILPTDEEFLQSLYQAPQDAHNPADDPTFLKESIEILIKGGAIPAGADPTDFVRAMFDPQRNFRGYKSSVMTNEARNCLPTSLHHLLDVPVAYLHIDELNGFVAPTPRGNAVIVLNLGIIRHAGMLSRCTLALVTYASPEPFCRDHQPAAFVHGIVSLARFVCTEDYDFLRKIVVWNCPSLEPLDIKGAQLGGVIEMFVLLHEYGHVASGHLNSSLITRKFGMDTYSQEHFQEHEADTFAFDHLEKRYGKNTSSFAAAVLFRFFDLIEHMVYGKPTSSSSHPAGRIRWDHLKEKFRLSDPEENGFGRVESLFDMILKVREGILPPPKNGASHALKAGPLTPSLRKS